MPSHYQRAGAHLLALFFKVKPLEQALGLSVRAIVININYQNAVSVFTFFTLYIYGYKHTSKLETDLGPYGDSGCLCPRKERET